MSLPYIRTVPRVSWSWFSIQIRWHISESAETLPIGNPTIAPPTQVWHNKLFVFIVPATGSETPMFNGPSQFKSRNNSRTVPLLSLPTDPCDTLGMGCQNSLLIFDFLDGINLWKPLHCTLHNWTRLSIKSYPIIRQFQGMLPLFECKIFVHLTIILSLS